MCWSFFNNSAGLNFTKNRLQHRCFPVKFAKFFRASILKSNQRLLLDKKRSDGHWEGESKGEKINLTQTVPLPSDQIGSLQTNRENVIIIYQMFLLFIVIYAQPVIRHLFYSHEKFTLTRVLVKIDLSDLVGRKKIANIEKLNKIEIPKFTRISKNRLNTSLK